MRARLSRDAEHDLAAIFDFTFDRWGEEQADRYVAGLHDRLDEIEGGAITRPVVGRNGLRQSTYRAHFLFLVQDEEGWLVVRILHRHSDTFAHLP